MTASIEVTIKYRRIWLAKAWVHVCSVLAWFVGERRAMGWAERGMWRIIRADITDPPLFRQRLRLP